MLDADSVSFQLAGIDQEGVLSATVPAGAVLDRYGFGNAAYAGTYQLDYGTVPYPVPLTPVDPAGSLIYDPSRSGTIGRIGAADGFESGVLGPAFTTYSSTPDGRIQVTDGYVTASGQYALLMDTTLDGPYNLNEAVWTVDLAGQSQAVLSFDHADFNDENDAFNGPFTGHSNADGVAISNDGVNWVPVFNAPFQSYGVWQHYSIDLAAAAAASGLTIDDGDFFVKFQQYDNFALPNDGRGYDNLAIQVNDPPDTDRFTITVDPGQTITVQVTPSSGLKPTVTLSEGKAVKASATAPAAGTDAVLQTYRVPGQLAGNGAKPRTYTVTVGGADGTIGDYTVKVILNAALESEGHGGSPNDELAGAQNIEGSFLNLHGANNDGGGPQPDRGAVLGSFANEPYTTVFYADFEDGSGGASADGFTIDNDQNGLWHLSAGRGDQPGHSPTHSFYYGQGEGPNGGGTYDVGYTAGDLVSPSITLPTGIVRLDFNYVLQTEGSTFFDAAQLQINAGAGWTTLASYSDVAESSTWTAAAPVDLSAYAGQTVQLRWSFDRVDSIANFYEGWYVDDVRIQAAELTDTYALSLTRGQALTVAATSQDGGAVSIELLDSAGNVVAGGLPAPTDANLITNGSFETGDFTGWTVATTGPPFIPWQVTGGGAGSGFGMAPTEPQDGDFVAWNGFDGGGPMQYTMYQDVAIPADAPVAQLSWQDRLQWNFTLGGEATEPRIYAVQVRDPVTDAVLETLHSFSTDVQAVNPTGDTGWQTHTADLSAYIGSTVRLYFQEYVPQSGTGPAQAEIDAVSLRTVVRPTNVDDLISNFVAPASGTYYIRVTGTTGTDYSLVATRNADFDLEDNNTIATAQPILAPEVAGRQWVLGALTDRTAVITPFDQGWWTDFGYNDPTNQNYFTGYVPDFGILRNFFAFDVPALGGQISTAEFQVSNPFYASSDPTENYVLYDVSTPITDLVGGAAGGRTDIFDDLGTGQSYGSRVFSSADDGAIVTIGLDAAAIAAIQAAQGGQFALGGALTTIDVAGGQQSIFAFSGSPTDTRQLVLGLVDSDFYRIAADGNKQIEVEVTVPAGSRGEFVNGIIPVVRLYDAGGHLVASSESGSKSHDVTLKYKVPKKAGGTYYVEVASADGSTGEYLLSVKGGSSTPASAASAVAAAVAPPTGPAAAPVLAALPAAPAAGVLAAAPVLAAVPVAPAAGVLAAAPVAVSVAASTPAAPLATSLTNAVPPVAAAAAATPAPAADVAAAVAPIVAGPWATEATNEPGSAAAAATTPTAPAPVTADPSGEPAPAFDLGLAGVAVADPPSAATPAAAAAATVDHPAAADPTRPSQAATASAPRGTARDLDLVIDGALDDVALADALTLDLRLASRRKALIDDGRTG